MITRASIWIILVISLTGSEAFSQVEAKYQPPLLPCSIGIDSDGRPFLELEASIVTPVGTFSIGGEFPMSRSSDYSYVVIRNRSTATDTVYELQTEGEELRVYLDGKAELSIKKRRVTIDITNGNVRHILFGYLGGCRILRSHSSEVYALDFAPDGKTLVSGSSDQTVKVWNLCTGKLTTLQGHEQDIAATAVLDDSEGVVSLDDAGVLRQWDIRTGKCLRKWLTHEHIHYAVFSPSARLLAAIVTNHPRSRLWWKSYSVPDSVMVWDVPKGKLIDTVELPDVRPILAWSSDDRLIATATASSLVFIKNGPPKKRATYFVKRKSTNCAALAFASDGKTLGSVEGLVGIWRGRETRIKVWDAEARKERSTALVGGTPYCNMLAFHPDGQTVARVYENVYAIPGDSDSCGIGRDVYLSLCDARTGVGRMERGYSESASGAVYEHPTSLCFSPGGQLLAAGLRRGDIHLIDLSSLHSQDRKAKQGR